MSMRCCISSVVGGPLCPNFGVTWYAATSFPSSTNGDVVAYSNGTWVAINQVSSTTGTNLVNYSSDGKTWYASNTLPFTSGATIQLYWVAGTNNNSSTYFIIAGTDSKISTTNPTIAFWYSTDGDNWTESALPSNAPLLSANPWTKFPLTIHYCPGYSSIGPVWVCGGFNYGVSLSVTASNVYMLVSTNGTSWQYISVSNVTI